MKKKRILILTGIFLVIMIFLFTPVMIKIKGEKEITIEVFSEYIDEGAVSRIGGTIQCDNQVDPNVVGTYHVTYQWFLEKATRTIHVVDTTPPVLNLNGEEEVEVVLNSKYVEKGYEVSDNYDSEVKVSIDNDLDTSLVHDEIITYNAVDSSNNTTTLTRLIHVVEDDYHYENNINNKAGASQDLVDAIIAFYNNYYKSLRYSNVEDFDAYYEDSQKEAVLTTALSYLFEYRKMSNNDLHLNDCYYDLTIDQVSYQNGIYTITFLEDCHVNFNFQYEKESNIYDIENTISLIKSEDTYRITDFEKGEGFYLMFYDSTSNLNTLYSQYMEIAKTMNDSYEKDRLAVNQNEAVIDLTATYPYNRDLAVEYANTYYHERNSSEYNVIAHNNCMNFGSQVIAAGGIPMDYTGNAQLYQQWKNYGPSYNANEEPSGLVYTWTYIPHFRYYIHNNVGAGLVAIVNANLYLGEGGDMVQVSKTSLDDPIHNLVVVGRVENEEGEVTDLLVNGNTLDMYNYPLSASCYPYKSLVKIIGYN